MKIWSQYAHDSFVLDRAYLRGTVEDVINGQADRANEELDHVDDGGDGETGGPDDEAELPS